MKTFKQINVPISIYERLKQRAKAHQSIGGVIEEMLNELEQPKVATAKPPLLSKQPEVIKEKNTILYPGVEE